MRPRNLWNRVIATLSLVSAAQSADVNGQAFPDLIDVTVEDVMGALDDGLFTSVDLVRSYLARIDEVNPQFNAVTEVNPDALDIAASLDSERAEGNVRGPLHGIPVLIKNNIATDDQMNNTAGSFALLGAKVPGDSFVAQKLREAGVIILGKANLSQWANFRSSNSSNGWSAHGGQVFAAYIEKQDPSGSSSGSGVSASLGLAVACLGTETDGSIISPSMRNNVVGIKPSVGLTSRHLVIPISEHQDTIGPMARTVKDAAYLLQAIAGPDSNDNYTSSIPSGDLPDYVAACTENGLEGMKIGVPDNVLEAIDPFFGDARPEIDAYLDAISVLEEAGATIVRNANFTAVEQWLVSEAEAFVLGADFISNLAVYLAQLTVNPNNITSLADVREFTQGFEAEEYPSRDTMVWDETLDEDDGFNNTDPRFFPQLQQQLFLGGDGGVLGALERGDLDAVILPSAFASPFAAGVGSPVVTVPLGFYPSDAPTVMNSRGNLVDTGPNVPFGLAFLGARFDEATIIGMAYAFEQKTMARNTTKPFIVPTAEIGDFASTSAQQGSDSESVVARPGGLAVYMYGAMAVVVTWLGMNL